MKCGIQTINKGLSWLLFPIMKNPVTRKLTTVCINFHSFFYHLQNPKFCFIKFIDRWWESLPLTFPAFFPHRKWNNHSTGNSLLSALTWTACWMTYKCGFFFFSLNPNKQCIICIYINRAFVIPCFLGTVLVGCLESYLFDGCVQSFTLLFGEARSSLQRVDSGLRKK